MKNLQINIDETEYLNYPYIMNIAKLSGTTYHAVSTYLIHIALNNYLADESDEDIAESIEKFYSKDK